MFFERYALKKDGVIRGYDVHSFRIKILVFAIMIICLVILAICIFPAVWVFLAGFKDIKEFRTQVTLFPPTYDFSKFIQTWNELHFLKYYINSMIMVAGCAVCAVIFNGLIAYGLAILKPKGHKFITGLVMWSLLIPATTSMVALLVNIKRIELTGQFLPVWLAYGANAFWVLLFKQYFEGMSKELFEAARLDGCGVLQIFFRILLPLSRPIIMVIVIFSITAAWSDFLLPFLVLQGSGKDTVMMKLFEFRTAPVTQVEVLRAILFSIIPPTIIFLFFQKQITDGAAAGAIKE